MLSIPATLGWYFFLIGVIWGFHRLTHCFSRLNIFSLFVASLILRNGITVPFDHDVNIWFSNILLSEQALQRFYWSLVMMYLGLLLGIYLGRRTFGDADMNEEVFRDGMHLKYLPAEINGPLFLLVLATGVGLVIALQMRFDVSLSEFLSGQLAKAEYYRFMRDQYGQETHYLGSVWLRLASITRFGLFPFFIYTLFFLKDRGWLWRGLFSFVLGVGLYIALLSGQKSPALFLLIGLGVAHYLRKGRLTLRILDWRIWAVLGVGLLGIIPFLYRLQYPDMEYSQAILSMLYRLTSEYNRSLQLYFEIYPNIHPHMYGLSSSLINSLLGLGIPVDSLPERFIPVFYLGPRYLNTWNACYVGVAWADFGYAGVVLESVMLGVLLQWYARWFSRRRKTALAMGTQVALMMAATRLSEVALTANLLSFGLGSSFLMFLLIKANPGVSKR